MTQEKKTKKQVSQQMREQPLTYDDYARLPDDGLRYELVDGKLELMSPSPARTHQIISGHLLHLLSLDCQSEYEIIAAPVDLLISATEVRQPDLVMIHLSRMAIYKERGSIEEPPDLVVEILSPSSVSRDKIAKSRSYAQFGVPEYWILDPVDETLEQYLLQSNKTYHLSHTYSGHEPIRSEKLKCVTFSMNQVLERVKNLPES